MDAVTPETDNVGSIEYFEEKLNAMRDEALSYGLAMIYAIESDDRFAKETDLRSGWGGGLSICLGMATRLKNQLERPE